MARHPSLLRAAAVALPLLISAAPPAQAAGPARSDPTLEVLPGPGTGERPVVVPFTPAEQRLLAEKQRTAGEVNRLLAGTSPSSGVSAALCPTSVRTADALDAASSDDAADAGDPLERITATGSGSCVSDFVAIYPRQQVEWNYCGPATVQQVSNHTWGIASWDQSVNKYRQADISRLWLQVEKYGGTSPYKERVGMNAASRLPSGFIYAEYQVVSGLDWHNKIITDVTGWNMPLTAAVAPHDVGYDYFLSSWANNRPVNTGHWIVMRGYYLKWDGTRNPLVYYTDSSGGLGGSTGRFYDPSFDVYKTLIKTNNVHPQGRWIVW